MTKTTNMTEVGMGRRIAGLITAFSVLWSVTFGAFHIDNAEKLFGPLVDIQLRTTVSDTEQPNELASAVDTSLDGLKRGDLGQPDRSCGSHCDQHSRGVPALAPYAPSTDVPYLRHALPVARGLVPTPGDPLYDPPRPILA